MNEMKNKIVKANESLDSIGSGRISVIQPRKGVRFAIDSILLASFASIFAKKNILDMGCGNGIISLSLAMLDKVEHVTGIDNDDSCIERAQRNAHINNLENKLNFEKVDIKQLSNVMKPELFETVVFNPPYRKSGTGRISPNPEKASANHELQASINDFAKAAFYSLKLGGKCIAIHLSERFPEVLCVLNIHRLEMKKVRFIHSFPDSESKMVLFQCQKGAKPGLIVEKPLVIYESKGQYSSEVSTLLYG